MKRLLRGLTPIVLTMGLTFGMTSHSLAQVPEVAPEPAPTEGDPLYGYIAMFFLAGGVLFIVCKSARR